MVTKLILVCVLVTGLVKAQTEEPVTVPPTESKACSGAIDVGFVLDSSSSIGEADFQVVREFVETIVSGLVISQDLTRIGVVRFTSWAEVYITFNRYSTEDEVLTAVGAIPYYGKGTLIGNALDVTASQLLQPYNGWRPDIPSMVMVITDGESQDAAAIPAAAAALKQRATRVLAIGVGPAVNITQLEGIASSPSSENLILLDTFSELVEAIRTDDALSKTCDLLNDVNECLVDNGGCSQICVNSYNNFFCACFEGYLLVGATDCVDIDECAVDNGGCSDICVNTPGSFSCQCPEGSILINSFQCVVDSCFQNDQCDQICNNVVNGDFFCSCSDGFVLDDDGTTCTDIDECAVTNGDCEFNCTNTPGSFFCSCQPGFGLRPDGKTCGFQCYTCDRATDNADCQTITICPPSELSCQTTTRLENGVTYISKSCKQTAACVNNYIQNPRSAWSPTQCNIDGEGLSVCRCCCHEALCNQAGDCTPSDTIDIFCPNPFDIFEINPPISLDCGENITEYTVGDTCQVVCPVGYTPDNGVTELLCTQEPRTTNGEWIGEIGVCVDINECLTNNGGCSDICTNTNGSFVCSCREPTPCEEQPVDLFFILDSSSSIGLDNFNLMTGFVSRFIGNYEIGQGPNEIRIGVITFNREPIKRIPFDGCRNLTECQSIISNIVYRGRGTRTARAIDFVVNDCLSAAQGRRANVPLVVIVITDGRSQRPRALPAAAERLNEVANRVFVIGVTRRVDEREISEIADNIPADYRIIETFAGLGATLSDLIGDRVCLRPNQPHVLTGDMLNCDFDECSVDNGGCSNFCNNTVGSYFCSCPEGQIIGEDGRTCYVDLCLIDNGNCSDTCRQFSTGRRCFCPVGKVLSDDTDCVDYDECLDENGGCSNECINLDPGYMCACPEGLILSSDLESCEADSCVPNPCDQTCTNILGGAFTCSCLPGFLFSDDGFNCTDIDECANQNGGCEEICVNTPGSYICECPPGQALRPDGKTCGILCYKCENVAIDEQCTEQEVCSPDQDTCFTTVRVNNNVTSITKGCEQTEACTNNFLQNNKPSGDTTQCNDEGISSKCECCCNEILCNTDSSVCDFTLPTCPQSSIEFVSYTGATGNSSVAAGGVAYVDCPPGFQFVEGSGLQQIECEYNFQNNTSEWESPLSELGTCEDIDECFNSTAGCIPPAICQNLPGSFECVCPDDTYELIDEFICEIDECAIDNGGCSHNCTNTIGSFICSCPPRLSLLDDGLTCNINECEDANAGCTQICVNTREGFECECQPGFELQPDGFSCLDIDECLTNNGGCSNNCTNLVPGFECSCPDKFVLDDDGFTCIENPCETNNGGCEQICTFVDGEGVCSCRPGFTLLGDGSCEDIDECIDLNPACQFNCTNTEGSFFCECPPGQGLRPDGRTCGRACYACIGASTNAECNSQPIQVCEADADACENEVREHGGKKDITKRCKQSQACNNNNFQNDQEAAAPTQCNSAGDNNVCRCCCIGHLCNEAEKPCVTEAPACDIERADVIVVADSSSSVGFENFQLVKQFITTLFNSFKLGDNAVHAALLRYNALVELQFNLASVNTKDEVDAAVADTVYDGSGTRTGAALQYVIDNLLSEAAGRRPEVPLIVVTITDGLSGDAVAPPSQELRRLGAITFAVGVGGADPVELNMLSGSPSRTFISDDFAGLAENVLGNLQAALCADVNECDNNNGGCSDTCVNLPGSYRCECPADLVLDADLRTCVAPDQVSNPGEVNVDECAENNGGCQDQCVNVPGGFECSCPAGFDLAENGVNCVATDNCANVSCSYKCANTPSGFFCYCLGNDMISDDMLTCVPRPGPADCPDGWFAYGHSCVLPIAGTGTNHQDAERNCGQAPWPNSRLVTVNDPLTLNILSLKFPGPHWIGLTDRDEEGVWVNSDGTEFTFEDGWASGQPGGGDCGYINNNAIFSSGCGQIRQSICEIPRDTGFAIYTLIWDFGANGKIYLPTGYSAVRVLFPFPVTDFTAWFGKINQTISASEYILSQGQYDTGGDGAIGFSLGFTRETQFPARNIVIQPYVN